jgi:transcriptional regulator with XRE-family HTH domain
MYSDDPQVTDDFSLLQIFASRLESALDSAGYPRERKRRLGRLSEQFRVTRPGARKWLAGEGLPSPTMLLRISSELGVTIDFLMGRGPGAEALAPLPALLGSPLYRGNTGDGVPNGVYPASFEEAGTIVIADTGVAEAPAYTFCVTAWCDVVECNVRQGDVLFVDASCRHLVERGRYVLRIATGLTFLRRAALRLDGAVEFLPATAPPSVSFPPEQLNFNPSGSLQAALDREGILVLGRIVGTLRWNS